MNYLLKVVLALVYVKSNANEWNKQWICQVWRNKTKTWHEQTVMSVFIGTCVISNPPFSSVACFRGRFVHPTSASIIELNWIKNHVSYLSKEFWKSVTSFHMNSVLAWHETSILDLVWLLFKQCSMFIIYLNVLYKLNEYCISVLCNVVTSKIGCSCSQLRFQHYLGECWGGFMLGLSKVARRMSVYCLKCLHTPCSDGVYQF